MSLTTPFIPATTPFVINNVITQLTGLQVQALLGGGVVIAQVPGSLAYRGQILSYDAGTAIITNSDLLAQLSAAGVSASVLAEILSSAQASGLIATLFGQFI